MSCERSSNKIVKTGGGEDNLPQNKSEACKVESEEVESEKSTSLYKFIELFLPVQYNYNYKLSVLLRTRRATDLYECTL